MTTPLADIPARTGFSEAALAVLQSAILRGHGTQAQFDHPELGGMGQWTRGGMIMIGDMFNTALAARVAQACELLATTAESNPSVERDPADWWPVDFGKAGMRASQNDLEYAWFPGSHRLAVRQNGAIAFYDLAGLNFLGVGAQSGSVVVHTDAGPRSLDHLPKVIG